jgi:hypothetical protein
MLILTRIECLDEEEDIGRDEIYVVSEEVRYPLAGSLDGSWDLDDDSEVFPGVVVDVRVSPPAAAGGPAPAFTSRMRLREGDPTVFEGPTDDTYKVFEIEWGETGTFEIVHEEDDAHYILEFRSFTVPFADPDPGENADLDNDGLDEAKEFQISVQDPAVQPAVVAGYHGLADPGWRETFVEIDSVGDGNRVPFDAKQMVVSQFQFQSISLRLDDGYLGGGQVHPYEETLTLDKLVNEYKSDPARFAAQRESFYRYGLFSDRVVGEGSYGVGSEFRKAFIVAHLRLGFVDLGHSMTAQYAPVLIMHEMGHTFGLCHRFGDKDPQAPGVCPVPTGWPPQCSHYCGVGQESVTAMGSDTTFDLIVEIIAPWGLAGVGAGVVIGGLIGGPPGAIIGGIIGGIVGSIFGSTQADFYLRFVDYHVNEWAELRFW